MTSVVLLIFAAVFCSAFAVTLAVAKARQSPTAKLKIRLKKIAEGEDDMPAEAAGDDLHRLLALATRAFNTLPGAGRLGMMLERSGINLSPIVFLLVVGIGTSLCFVALYLLRKNLLIALLDSTGFVLSVLAFLTHRKKQREILFTEQLPDALTMISRSLRAGHSLSGAVELVSEELPDPAGNLFKIAFEQQRLGMRMADSLATLPAKMESLDLSFFVTVIRINSETGGNLSEILDKLAETIRSRLQIRRQVQVVTAEGRMSGYVLVVLPIVVFFMFYVMRPGYMDVFFTDRTCRLILIATALAQVFGFLFIRKIINIRI